MQFTLNDIVNKETKPHAYEKWCEVFKRMRVHTQGITPLHIFEERRPLESEDANALTYRANNSRPITKDEFDKAISHYQELAQNVDVVIDYKTSTNKDYIENLLLPLPPLNEQKRIVEKVDQLMALCDELEKNIEQSKNDSELLMQSVLQEAFKEA